MKHCPRLAYNGVVLLLLAELQINEFRTTIETLIFFLAMARIIFVGIHNKPGKQPLDSSTMTGKVVDKIAALVGQEFIKTNLCEVEYFVKDFAEINEHAIAWHKKYEPTPADTIVTLGAWVKDHFWYDNLNVVSIGHPAGVFGPTNKDKYISSAVEKIKVSSHESIQQGADSGQLQQHVVSGSLPRCDYRNAGCVNDGEIIDGVWVCNNHKRQ